MTLTKNDIIEEIRIKNGFSRNKSIETVETLLEIIKQTLVPERMFRSADSGNFVSKRKRNGKVGTQIPGMI